jgi:hypothetical protein
MKENIKMTKKKQFVIETPKELPPWKCEECGVHSDKLYDTNPWLVCIDCKEADIRRRQLKKSELEFNNGLGGQNE